MFSTGQLPLDRFPTHSGHQVGTKTGGSTQEAVCRLRRTSLLVELYTRIGVTQMSRPPGVPTEKGFPCGDIMSVAYLIEIGYTTI